MTLEGWIFMVGLRVFDVGALVVWLVWFFKLRDDEDDDGDDFRRDDEDAPDPDPRGPPGLRAPAARRHAVARAPPRPPRRRDAPPRAPARPRRPRARSQRGPGQGPLSSAAVSWPS